MKQIVTKFADGHWLSTVKVSSFVALLDASLGLNRPHKYETMLFFKDDMTDIKKWFYSSEKDAIKGHLEAVKFCTNEMFLDPRETLRK